MSNQEELYKEIDDGKLKLKDIGDVLVEKYNFQVSMDICIIDEDYNDHMEFGYCVYNNTLVETNNRHIPISIIILDNYIYVCEATNSERDSVPILLLSSDYITAFLEDYCINTIYFDEKELENDLNIVLKIIDECIDTYLEIYKSNDNDEELIIKKNATSIYKDLLRNRRLFV